MGDGTLWFGILLALVALAGVAVLLLSYSQTKKFRTVHINARPDGLKSSPKRICLISDLHFPMFNLSVSDVADSILKVPCDAIMIAGDLTSSEKGMDGLMTFLRLLGENSTTPVLIVLGNHDMYRDKKALDAQALKKYVDTLKTAGENVKVLENSVEVLKISGTDSKMVVVGISDFRHTSEITAKNVYLEGLAAADENDTLVVLEHNPDIMNCLDGEFAASGRDNVVLSGHTHGGQFWLPFNLEFLLLRKDKLPKKGYKYGLYDWNANTKLYISCGLGESFLPIRFGTTPEIVFFDY